MLLSAVSVLVVAQSSSEIPEGLMNNPVFKRKNLRQILCSGSELLLAGERSGSDMSKLKAAFRNYAKSA